MKERKAGLLEGGSFTLAISIPSKNFHQQTGYIPPTQAMQRKS